MTKEELKNEAAAYAKKHRMLSYCDPADVYVSDEEEIINAILHFAEPREDQITAAKAIIKGLLESCYGYNSKSVNYEIKARAEQFLKEE